MADAPFDKFGDQLQSLIREELSLVKKQLEELKNGQAALASSMGEIHESVGSLSPKRCKSRITKQESPQRPFKEQSNPAIEPTVTIIDHASEVEGGSSPEHEPDDIKLSDTDEVSRSIVNMQSSVATETPASASTNMRLMRKPSQKFRYITGVSDNVKRRNSLSKRVRRSASLLGRLRMFSPQKAELVIDSVVSVIIALNAIFIGISADQWEGGVDAWCFVDLAFSVLFALELVVKLKMHSFSGHFCAKGHDKWYNIFDVVLVVLDFIQLMLVFFLNDVTIEMQEMGIPPASLFRVVRLLRVIRVLRLLRHPSFDALLQMLEGIILGSSTLAWAMVLFGIIVYIVALLCRDLFGNEESYKETYPYFKSVPRAMFTVFRCSFGDCSTEGGTPIPEFIEKYYGSFFSLCYTFFFFFVAIGLFNVISAIFVNTTIAQQEDYKAKALQERFADDELWATRVCIIVQRCLVQSGRCEDVSLSPEDFETGMKGDLPAEIVDIVCKTDKAAIDALKDLDIDPFDNERLADILDPDHSGMIAFDELVNGLERLRGQPRRSDIVTVDLMLRSAQSQLEDIHSMVYECREASDQLCETSREIKQATAQLAKRRQTMV